MCTAVLQAKQATMAGIKDMDKLVRARNQLEIAMAGPAKAKQQPITAKERALEYAKNVPRPKV